MSDMFKNTVKNLISPELILGAKELIFFFHLEIIIMNMFGKKNPVTSNFL